MNFRQKTVVFLATGCFIGKIPIAPGTFGSIAGLPLCLILSMLTVWMAILCVGCFISIALLIAQMAASLIKKNDPGCIVIDEIAGMLVTFIGIPFNPLYVGAGFCIFRIFDIVKPFPARYLEKKLSGGAGIVFDDVAAGIYSNIVLQALTISLGAN